MRTRRAASVAAALLLGAACLSPLRAQGGLLLQGILDAEAWSTDTLSNTLTRNRGRAAVLGRLQLWSAIEPWRGFVLFAQGEALLGAAHAVFEPEDVELEQAGLRFSRSPWFVIDAGKMPTVLGVFAARRFSDRNPLIGVPDAYPVAYPLGLKLSGASNSFDYRAAVVSRPMTHEGYVPDASNAPRPVLGVGITPMVGLRIGASGTWGPYLNKRLSATQLNNRAWDSYGQRIAAADVQFAHGYLETFGEVGMSWYDVPYRADAIKGMAYYVETKYTLHPRLFVAGRFERNDYPFIASFGGSTWTSRTTSFNSAELGAGYRLTATTLLKGSYLVDRWHVTSANSAFIRPGGHAFAFQLSQRYDVMDWVDRLRGP